MSETPTTNGRKTISYSMWDDLLQICKERELAPEVVTCPERHKDGISVVRRSNVLKAMKERGWREDSLLTLCPIDPTSYYRALKR
jgi:hypothetical protein